MALHKTSTPNCSGFSLVEVTMVLALFALAGSLALIISFQSLKGYSFFDTRQLLVTVLQKARSQSLSNVCEGDDCSSGLAHGVHVDSNQFVLFQGPAYNPSDAHNVTFMLQNSDIRLSSSEDIVFAPLTTIVVAPGSVTVTDSSGHNSTVTVGPEGQIAWSN